MNPRPSEPDEKSDNISQHQSDEMFNSSGEPQHPDLQDIDSRSANDPVRSGLADQENGRSSQLSGSGSEADDLAKASGGVGSVNFTGSGDSGSSKTLKSRGSGLVKLLKKPRSIAGIAGGGGLTGVLIAGFFAVQPLQLVHFSQLLQRFHFFDDNQTSNSRTSHIINYARGTKQNNNMGLVGNKLANKYEKKLAKAGIKLDYNDANGVNKSSIQQIEVNPTTPEGRRFVDKFQLENPDINVGEFRGQDGIVRFKTTGSISANGDRAVNFTRASIKTLVNDGLDLDGVSAAVSKRVLTRRVGAGFHPLRNIAREKTQDLTEYVNGRREERAKKVKEGESARPDLTPNDGKVDKDGNGTPETDLPAADAETEDATKIASEAAKGEAAGIPKKKILDSTTKELIDRLRNSSGAKAAGAATAIVGLSCAAKDLGNQAEELQYAQTIVPMIRLSVQYISIGSQIMTGQDVDADEVGSAMKALRNVEKDTPDSERSWTNAKSIQAELGQEPTGPDIPAEANPATINGKPAFFDFLDNIPGLSAACSISDTASKWIGKIPGVKQAQDVMSKIVSGSIAVATDKSLEDWVGSLVSFIAGDAMNPLVEGAELGNVANYATKLSSNESMTALGGEELSNSEMAEWKKTQTKTYAKEIKQQSFFTRFFDLKNPTSVSAVALLGTPATSSPEAAVAKLKSSTPISLFASSTSGVLSAMIPKANAASAYNYGFKDVGFSQAILDNPRYEDPFVNSARVEPQLAALNAKWGKCFGNPVDDQGNITPKKSDGPDASKSAECTTPDNRTSYEDYKMYILDNTAIKSLACYESIDENACDQIGINPTSDSGTTTTAPTTPGGKGIVGDPYTDGVSVACAAGTKDLGENDAYADGKKFRVRLCSILNAPSSGQADNPGSQFSTPGADGHVIVNSRVSGAWFSLFEDAKAANINFRPMNSSFRSMPHQQALWNKDPNPQYTAPPGYSSHQAGIAIDFGNMSKKAGKSCGTDRATLPSNPEWKWLYDNSGTYGFKQYSAEAWHWDALPASSRCGKDQNY